MKHKWIQIENDNDQKKCVKCGLIKITHGKPFGYTYTREKYKEIWEYKKYTTKAGLCVK